MTLAALDGVWEVVSYLDEGGLVSPAFEATLVVEGDRIAGTMGVNRLMGRLEDALPAGPIAVTLMAGLSEAMDQEAKLLRHLEEADEVEVGDWGMRMSRGGLTTIEFQRSGTEGGSRSS